jgi:hypothetical protein
MWVVMTLSMSGGRYDGRTWPPRGVPFQVPDWEGRDLVKVQQAVEIDTPAWAVSSPPPPAPAPEPEPTVVSEPSATSAGPAVVAEDAPGLPEAAADGAEAPEAAPDEEDVVPGPGDTKRAWVDYAVSKGASPAEAATQTKTQLQQAYGGRLLLSAVTKGASNG